MCPFEIILVFKWLTWCSNLEFKFEKWYIDYLSIKIIFKWKYFQLQSCISQYKLQLSNIFYFHSSLYEKSFCRYANSCRRESAVEMLCTHDGLLFHRSNPWQRYSFVKFLLGHIFLENKSYIFIKNRQRAAHALIADNERSCVQLGAVVANPAKQPTWVHPHQVELPEKKENKFPPVSSRPPDGCGCARSSRSGNRPWASPSPSVPRESPPRGAITRCRGARFWCSWCGFLLVAPTNGATKRGREERWAIFLAARVPTLAGSDEKMLPFRSVRSPRPPAFADTVILIVLPRLLFFAVISGLEVEGRSIVFAFHVLTTME